MNVPMLHSYRIIFGFENSDFLMKLSVCPAGILIVILDECSKQYFMILMKLSIEKDFRDTKQLCL
jgi:hypothetical protein